MCGKRSKRRFNQAKLPIGCIRLLFAGSLLWGLSLTVAAQSPPSKVGATHIGEAAQPSVRIRVEEFFGVNDDDDNANEVYDSDATESPFLDSKGNPILDDDLIPAKLDFINSSEDSLEGYHIRLFAPAGLRIWNSPGKEYDLTHAAFPIDETGIPRWQAPDGTELVFPDRVFIEGINPGTGTLSITLFDNEEAGTP